MPTAADLQAQIAAASQQLAAADLITLQTFLTLASDRTQQMGTVLDAANALAASIGDPNRQAQITNAVRAWPDFLGTIGGMIATATAIANPAP